MSRSTQDARGNGEASNGVADPFMMQPLAAIAYMAAKEQLRERFAQAPEPNRPGTSPRRRTWRDAMARKLRGMADRLEPAGVSSNA